MRIFEVDTAAAPDVSSCRTVGAGAGAQGGGGACATAAPKRLVLDLSTLGLHIDNFEGMSLGPTLPDGSRSLLLVRR
eukprot:COSAG01_NODE_3227_length_6384_cov_6.269690_7_plen_77_part_00